MKGRKGYSKEEISAIRDRVIELRERGMNYGEISGALQISNTYVRHFCIDAGITAKEKRAETREKCRELRTQGKKFSEICAILGIGVNTVSAMCKGLPMVKRDYAELRNNDGKKRQIEKAKQKYTSILESFGWTDIQQIDGKTYTGVCSKCGYTQYFCRYSLNQGTGHDCINCKEIEKAAKQQKEEERRKQKKEELEHKKEERLQEQLTKKESRKHKCPVCGKDTYRTTYCSSECAKTASNKLREMRRRVKISNALVDKSITLKRLFRRDKGKCQICGGYCDYSDFTIKDGAFIVGEKYPSIDHIVPLSKGGVHSWENVQLAHWWCNTKKGNSIGTV